MASVNYYLDTRSQKKTLNTHPLKLSLSLGRGNRFFLPTQIYLLPSQWVNGRIVKHPYKMELQNSIDEFRAKVELEVVKLSLSGEIRTLSIAQLKRKIEVSVFGHTKQSTSVVQLFDEVIATKSKKSTMDIYDGTKRKIEEYIKDEPLYFSTITTDWLRSFEKHMLEQGLKINSINLHMRNLRAVYKEAIDKKLVSADSYPFTKFKIKKEATAKRSLTIEGLRSIRDYKGEPHIKQCTDIFMLIFYLRGINVIDLCQATAIENGYLEYRRSKTGKLYKIKVEPEAQALIDKYKGVNYLINVLDRYDNYKNYLERLNKRLKELKGEDGNILFNGLSTYWARHSWATIAASKDLQIPKDTIAAGLGHGGNTVTDIYIDYDQTIIDDANRKIIDYLNRE